MRVKSVNVDRRAKKTSVIGFFIFPYSAQQSDNGNCQVGFMPPVKLDTPIRYRITVQGCLNSSWVCSFCGMTIYNEVSTDKTSISVLTGTLVDQPALFGVLGDLYGLGFPLLSVECLEVNPAAR